MTSTDEGSGTALRLTSAARTDVGKQREQNEDACFDRVVSADGGVYGLFIVADGMGGYKAGEIASRIAVETLSQELLPLLGPITAQTTVPLSGAAKASRGRVGRRSRSKATSSSGRVGAPTRELSETFDVKQFTSRLEAAIQASSKAIVEYGNAHSDARGLGSTVTMALVIEGQAFIANVGDSRTYLLRDGALLRITQDHSLVERLVQSGQIERGDIYDHPHRNLIYRSLGANRSDVEHVDVFLERLRPGDVLLLCSDGLWEMVRDPELENILREIPDPAAACARLIERANENGGEDNISAVVVRCEGS
jgi:PPM family protein phosphatase